jgi:hypothetical protein
MQDQKVVLVIGSSFDIEFVMLSRTVQVLLKVSESHIYSA